MSQDTVKHLNHFLISVSQKCQAVTFPLRMLSAVIRVCERGMCGKAKTGLSVVKMV